MQSPPDQYGAAPAASGAGDGVSVPSSAGDEAHWARQALQVLDTFDAAVREYHAGTALPAGSAQRVQLTQSAYAGFQSAVAQHQSLLATTEAVRDEGLRDQFMFVLGNIGGFLNPTPDLAGDPPTLGDRIARSLENAIAGSASLRPKLLRVAGSG